MPGDCPDLESVRQAEDVPESACYAVVGQDAGQRGVELGQRGGLSAGSAWAARARSWLAQSFGSGSASPAQSITVLM